jgi:RNA polymerase sigma-70 factor (ECF subfamily)
MESLYNTALRLSRNPDTAEDLVAETVSKAWAAFAKLEERDRFRAWIFRILTNTFISSYRKQKTEGETVPYVEEPGEDDDEQFSLFESLHQPFLLWWDNPEQTFVNNLLREEIDNAINALSDEFKTVVMLIEVQGFSYEETAEIMDVPIGTIRSRLKRARSKLQKALWQEAMDAGIRPQSNQEGISHD